MLITDTISELQNLTKKKITYEQIASILGVSIQAIGNRVRRNSEFKKYEINKLEDYFNVSLNFCTENLGGLNVLSNSIIVDYYTNNIGCFIDGKFCFSELKQKISIPIKGIKNYITNNRYFVMNSTGDGMAPTLSGNDLIIAEYIEDDTAIKDNDIYIFYYNNKCFIKRLVQNIDKIILISDNCNKAVYPIQYINNNDINNVFIVGKIVGLIRNI